MGDPDSSDSSKKVILTPESKVLYEQMFKDADVHKHGLLDGARVRDLLLPSGLNSNDLAQIWKLSSLRKTKSLDIVEFCIALCLVGLKLKGETLPDYPPGNLIPFGYPIHPSVRKQMNELNQLSVQPVNMTGRVPSLTPVNSNKKLAKLLKTSRISSFEQLGWEEADSWDIFDTPRKVAMT